jgi:iron complex transport system ATP-binding protein
MIARALAQEPAILLLDEPTAFLDVPSRVELMGLLRRLARREQLAVVVSTHDLELALRMADTIWLVSSERKMHTGTPEDIILAGTVADAFQADNIKFHPEERTFRLVIEARGRAVVEGEGLRATLVAAVLEREGYEVVAEGESPLRITTGSDSNQWEVASGGCRYIGKDFATLARLARSIGAEPDAMQ